MKRVVSLVGLFSVAFFYTSFCSERALLETILTSRFVALDDTKKEQLKNYGLNEVVQSAVPAVYSTDKPIFEYFPALQSHLICLDLGSVSVVTPVRKLFSLGQKLGVNKLFMKDDGFGDENTITGNKRRKLEFILADAVKNGAQHVVTFGGIGSNHAAQTAHFAHELGLQCTLHLAPQPLSHGVHNNLLIDQTSGAEVYVHNNWAEIKEAAFRTCIECKEKTGLFPYVIPVGGSNALGSVGYVNAAFEFKKQTDAGEMPIPDYIYCPIGSRGTAAGLVVGLRAAGINSKIVLVEIDEDDTKERYTLVAQQTNQLLHDLDSSFPLVDVLKDVSFERGFSGCIPGVRDDVYGLYTEAGMEAKHLFKQYEEIVLDGSYTAKAASALVHDLRTKPELKEAVILYWHTFGIHKQIKEYNKVQALQPFFEGEVQPLDQAE